MAADLIYHGVSGEDTSFLLVSELPTKMKPCFFICFFFLSFLSILLSLSISLSDIVSHASSGDSYSGGGGGGSFTAVGAIFTALA